jgi:hypothetical protein
MTVKLPSISGQISHLKSIFFYQYNSLPVQWPENNAIQQLAPKKLPPRRGNPDRCYDQLTYKFTAFAGTLLTPNACIKIGSQGQSQLQVKTIYLRIQVFRKLLKVLYITFSFAFLKSACVTCSKFHFHLRKDTIFNRDQTCSTYFGLWSTFGLLKLYLKCTIHHVNAKMIMYLLTSDAVLVSSHNSHHLPRLDETFNVRKVD